MNNKFKLILPIVALFMLVAVLWIVLRKNDSSDNKFITYTLDPKKQNIKFYWKNNNGKILGSIKNLKAYLEKENTALIFATNGGMYNQGQSPKGLFIQEKNQIIPIDTLNGDGNFYLKPNGVFYIMENNIAGICSTSQFINDETIKYATQSGPMLVIDGQIHPAFKKASTNLNIRNGVGILPNGNIVFAMSKKEINFYDFASFFINQGCRNALYFDGFVSKTYLPEKKWIQEDGNFGVIIGITKSKN